MRAFVLLVVPSLAFAQQPAVSRINVTPAAPRVIAGETLQLQAEALDAGGRPVPGATIRFQQTAAQFEGAVDDKGLVRAGAVGTIPKVTSICGYSATT